MIPLQITEQVNMIYHSASDSCSSICADSTRDPSAPSLERYEAFLASLAQREYPPEPDVILAFRKLLTEPSVSLVEAARLAVASSIPDSPDLPVSNMTLWIPFGEAIEQFPEMNDRLVDFIVALQQLPDGDGAMHELPYFREYCNEFWLFCKSLLLFYSVLWPPLTPLDQDPPRSDPDLAKKRQAWYNMNTFMATLAARGVRTENLLQHAGRLLQNALETAPWEEYHFPEIEEAEEDMGDEYEEYRDRELERLCDIRHLNGTIPAVAQWIKIQGRALYEMAGPMDLEREELWDGPPGWSKERWKFWRQRFEWVASVTALDRRTKNIAREAAEEMARISGDA